MTVLETERLLFRDHEPSDLDAYCEIEADPEVRRYVGAAPRSREAAEQRFGRMFQREHPSLLTLWATIYKPDGRYIGYCGVYPNFAPGGPVPGEGTLGYTLARDYWGKGLATEAASAFVDFGFNELHLSRIVTAVEVGHRASIRVLEKLGFELLRTETGEFRSFYHFQLLP